MALEKLLRSVSYKGGASLVFSNILAPVMTKIGDLWHSGEVSVGQEHMASFLIEGTLRNMLQTLEFPDDAPTAVLACAEIEEHTLPVFGVAFSCAKWGCRPVMLGARTPASALKSAIEGVSPVFVGLSLTVTPAPHQIRRMMESYLPCCGQVPLILGGAGAIPHRDDILALGGLCPKDVTSTSFLAVVDSIRGGSA
jgi:methanogenic corrinoid protein MtbC1